MENIISAFDEVCKNVKNKNKVQNYKQYKCIYISRIYNILNNKLNELTEKEKNTQDIKDFTKLEELLNREDLIDVYYKLDSLEKKRFWTSFIKTIYVDDNSNLEVIFL